MNKKYFFKGLMSLSAVLFSSCNKNSNNETSKNNNNSNDHNQKDYLAELKSSFANFSQQGAEVNKNLNTIANNFENLRKKLPQTWSQNFSNTIENTTDFLNKLAKKTGENIKDKIDVLQKIVSLYTEKLNKNLPQQSQVTVVELNLLSENFKDCLDQLLTATDDFDNIFNYFSDRSIIFGALEKMFKTIEEHDQELLHITDYFKSNYPINNLAKSVLTSLSKLNLDILKESYTSLKILFIEKSNKDLDKQDMEAVVNKVNEEIFKCYKKLVELTVLKKSKDFFTNFGLDEEHSTFKFFHKYEKDEKEVKLTEVNLTDVNFNTKYINLFLNYFTNIYHLDLHEFTSNNPTAAPKWKIKFSLNNFNPSNKDKFFTAINEDCALEIKTTTDGENFHYVTFKDADKDAETPNGFFEKNSKLLSCNDKLYYGIQTLHLMLSAGFQIQKGGISLDKTIDTRAEHLLNTPRFSLYKENDKKVEKFESICDTPLGSVDSLWRIFQEAYNNFQINVKKNDNKEIFHHLWTLRNAAYYIKDSCDNKDILGKDDNSFVTKMLTNILDGQDNETGNTPIPGIYKANNDKNKSFWGEFVKNTLNGQYDHVKRALAEYFVMRCGLFNKNVKFDYSSNELINTKDIFMSFDNMKTFGLWKWNDKLPELELDDEIKDLGDFFKIENTIEECAAILGEKVFDTHLDASDKNRLQEFLNVRNKFYSDYPEGIYNITSKDDLKNFLIEVARVAQAANKFEKFNDKNSLFNWVVKEFLYQVYGSDNILKHVETCFATNEEECKKYTAAYWIKFVENILQDSVIMDTKIAKIKQNLVSTNSVENVKDINLDEISKKNRAFRIFDRKPNESYLSSSSPFNKDVKYDAGYVEKDDIGINAIVANICKIVNHDWKTRAPKLNVVDEQEIQSWFDKFKIYVYTIKKSKYLTKYESKKRLYVGDEPAMNLESIFEQDGDDSFEYFTLGRDLKYEIFVSSSTNSSEIKPDKNSNGENVAKSDDEYKSYDNEQLLKNSKYDYFDTKGLDFKNIKFLEPLFGNKDIIMETVYNKEVPGFIFKFDYYGYSDLYGKYSEKSSSYDYFDWIRVQNCQM